MSLELKPGWLERQAKELTRPYSDEELAALNDDVGPFPSVHRMGATVAVLRTKLEISLGLLVCSQCRGQVDKDQQCLAGHRGHSVFRMSPRTLLEDIELLRTQLAEAREQVRTLTEERLRATGVIHDYFEAFSRISDALRLDIGTLAPYHFATTVIDTLSRLREALGKIRSELWSIQERVDRGQRESAFDCIGLQRIEIDAALSLLDPVASEPKPEDGAGLIAAERQRQVSVEGWTREHDAQHEWHELALAAKCYVMAYIMASLGSSDVRCLPSGWPWEPSWWKPSPDPIRNLVKAGALIAAEIDRLQGVSVEPAPAESKEAL